MSDQTWWQTIEEKGEHAAERIKEIVAEGNVRRVRIKQKDRVVAEFPLTLGVVGAVLAPVFAAIATMTSLLTDCTIEVEKVRAHRMLSTKAQPDLLAPKQSPERLFGLGHVPTELANSLEG